MTRKHIVILQNKPEDFRVFLNCLRDSIKDKYKFHLVTDTRSYRVMPKIKEMATEAKLDFKQYDGAIEVRRIMEYYSFGEWFQSYHKSCKLILPILFHDLGKFLYMDDDCLILNDPEDLWNWDFCSGRETVFARITNKERWEAYRNVARNSSITQDWYNHNQINSGTFMYTCRGLEGYISLIKGFTLSRFIEKEFQKGRFILDEEILSFHFAEMKSSFVGQKLINIRNGAFAYRSMITDPPLVYHYAVKDEYTADYRDYFSKAYLLENIVLSGFPDKASWERRERSVAPTFKQEMRARYKK